MRHHLRYLLPTRFYIARYTYRIERKFGKSKRQAFITAFTEAFYASPRA